MINVLKSYKDILSYYSKIDIMDNNDIGKQFEIEINNKVITEFSGFALYWQVMFDLKFDIGWTLTGTHELFKSNNTMMDINTIFPTISNKIYMDHIIITPFAVFLLEAKNHSHNKLYKSNNSNWVDINALINHCSILDIEKNTITSPVAQVLFYSKFLEYFMSYYKIGLPIIKLVVFKQGLDLSNILQEERQYCIYFSQLNNLFNEAKRKYILKPNDALKLIKILYYYKCHPIAYDINKIYWSV